MRHASFGEIRSRLSSRTQLLEQGWTDRGLAAALAEQRLHRVRRGWYIDHGEWQQLWPESRHVAHVIAVALDAREATPVFSHVSAAVLWGLPLYRLRPRRVHVAVGSSDRRSAPDVQRHEGRLDEADIAERHGLLCTTLDRTVVDVVRTTTAEAGIALTDVALASETGDPRAYDWARAGAWRARMSERVAGAAGARGIRRARHIVELADGRAELPGESVSRLQLIRLGFVRPELQVRVDGSRGEYWVDFGFPGVRAFGEFDGKGKYTDEALRSGRSIEQVLLDEKAREDDIRGRTQWRFGRWGDEHAASPQELGRRLEAFGILPRP